MLPLNPLRTRACIAAATALVAAGCGAHVPPSEACANHPDACRTEACTEKTWITRWCGAGPDPLPVARALPRASVACDTVTGLPATTAPMELGTERAYCGLVKSLRDDACPPQAEEYSTGKTGCLRFRSMRMTRLARALVAASERYGVAARRGRARLKRPPECAAGSPATAEATALCHLLDAVDAHPCPIAVQSLPGGDACVLYRSLLLDRFATALSEEAFHLARAAAISY